MLLSNGECRNKYGPHGHVKPIYRILRKVTIREIVGNIQFNYDQNFAASVILEIVFSSSANLLVVQASYS